MTLTNNGFEVVAMAHPGEALSVARTESLDLYLLDNWMSCGLDLCRKIREIDTKTSILFCSAAAFECGAQGYVVKPATPKAALAEVGRLIAVREDSDVTARQVN